LPRCFSAISVKLVKRKKEEEEEEEERDWVLI